MSNTQNTSKDINQSPMIKIASFIVDKRMLFFLLYILMAVFSAFSRNWVGVENELAQYLSADTETRQGLDLMDKEFTTLGTADIMVANIAFDDAAELADRIREMDGVSEVAFASEDEEQSTFLEHYNNGSALYSITFIYDEKDSRALESLNNVREALLGYDIYVTTGLGNQQADIIEEEIGRIMVLVAIVVVSVLLMTSESYGEIPVLCITFVASMILNMGTNFLFGTISFVSNSVSSILQLALSVDYAIIFCNRYKEEYAGGLRVRDAVVVALSKSIPEILSSSLTTISGLLALIFMHYKIGADMGTVLIKAILLSLLSVFTLMPGLIMLFAGNMERTRHKSFVPKISWVGSIAWYTRHIVPVLFVIVFVLAFYFSNRCPYVYGYSTLTTPVLNETQIAENMIRDNFGEDVFLAVVVPGHNYKNEARLMEQLESMQQVDYCQGLANTEAVGGYMLTDTLSPRQFSELAGIDYELVEVLYSAYAAQQEEYGRIIGGISSYKVPLMDMFMFVYEKMDEGYVTLDEELTSTLTDAYEAIGNGRKQLEGSDYDRILVYLTLPEESDETFAFIDTIHRICEPLYGDEPVYVVGESTSQKDLRSSFETDNIIVSVVSVLFVLVILLFTFQSAGMPVLLIVVIEGAIFINFSYPTLTKENLFFMSYLIVSSIQMGANIDYAIVISSRYQELRKTMDRRTSITEALNFAFPTIITSGSMMILAGVFIGQMTSDPCIASIGQCLGRGTTISVFLVMFVMPQILLTGDGLIARTAFDIATPIHTRDESGTMVINGTVRGTINGTVVGTMNAIVRGDINVVVLAGGIEKRQEYGTGEPDIKPVYEIEASAMADDETSDDKTTDDETSYYETSDYTASDDGYVYNGDNDDESENDSEEYI